MPPPKYQVPDAKKQPDQLISSAGKIFPDGTVVELVRDSDGTLKFLVWDGHTAKIVDKYTRGEQVYTTPKIHRSVCDALVLPSGRTEFGSARQLFDQIAALISRASGGIQSLAVPLTFLIFSTWLIEFAPIAPYIWIVLPATWASVALMQILQLLCRHALVVSALATNWPNSLPMALQPTLVGAVDKPSRRLLNVLGGSQSHGIQPTRAGQVVDLFCAKVILSREPLEDASTAGFPLEIILAPEDEYVPPLNSGDTARVADEFQDKLLGYRLANLSRMAPPKFDLGRVAAPVRALAHSLGGAIVGDDDLQAQILPYLRQYDADVRSERGVSLDATIVRILLARWNDVEIGVTDLCADVNSLTRGQGRSGETSPESLGWKLRALDLRTTDISKGLKGLKMDKVRPAIAKLAALHGLRVPEGISTSERPLPRQREGGFPR